MSKKPWFPFIIDDWWGSTRVRLMGAEARDLYLDCLCRQWKDGAIPTDPKALAAILPGGRSAAAVARLWPKLAPHFEPSGDGLVANPKLDALRRKAHAVSEVRAQAGKRGGRPKGELTASDTASANANATANAFDEPKQSGTQSDTRNQKLETEGEGTTSSLPPGSSSLRSEEPSPIPAGGSGLCARASPARRPGRGNGLAKSTAVWDAYAEAYEARYGVPPVRNARTNGCLAQLVDRLGAAEAPQVAAWYVGHSRAVYVAARHDVSLLLRDAEGLRTEWATGRIVTTTQARQADQTAANTETLRVLLADRAAREGTR